jgi:aminopeptidase N
LFGAVAHAQAAPAVGGTRAHRSVYQPGIDVLDYDFRLDLPDTGAFLRADVTLAVRREPGVASLTLDLVDGLTVRSVEVNGRVVTAGRPHDRIDVPLAGAAGDSVKVRVLYDGMVTDGLIAQRDAQGRWTWFGDNWPDRARQWLATVDHPSDKATVSWTVRAPTGRVVVANGALLGVRRLGTNAARSETRWRESHPIPTDIMVIAAGPLAKFDLPPTGCGHADGAQCIQQSVYVLPENVAWLPGPFAAAQPIVGLFERLVGPFPYEKLAHLQSATRFGGMENASAIFYAYDLFATRKMTEGLIAHETAHQWFGDSVTELEWGHLWLSEGFATYFAALWTRQSRGDDAFRGEMRSIRAQILADTAAVPRRPVLDTAETNYLSLLNTNSYQKGGYILYMLNRRLGDSAFFGGLRSYYRTYRDGNATSDDLRHELERSSGQSLERFFTQWLRRPGVAEPTIGWAYDPTIGTVSLLVIQDSPRGAYELPLTVLVTQSSGEQKRFEVTLPAEPRATIVLPEAFTVRPASLTFDPDGFLLARITRL